MTVRNSTERPETIAVGANRIVGTDSQDIRRGVRQMNDRDGDWENPFGDGTASQQILDATLTAQVEQ